ncbi:hypothetical protein Tco_0128453 [Tanacetum coccineum]
MQTTRKSRAVRCNVRQAKKKFFYASVGSKFPRTTRSEPTEARIHFGGRLRTISTKAWRVLKTHPKWDAPEPLDADDHTELFDPDERPRPAVKPRPTKKTKSETTKSGKGSHLGSILEPLYED